MTTLLHDPDRLRDRLALLEQRRASGVYGGAELEALAEAYFRVAVHPGTPAEEAFALLKRAIRLDGANPKLAYHVARLYLVHGELDRAAEWLTLAQSICPTSHRIWVHVSLLQRELNARYDGDERYDPGALRASAKAIAAAVKNGNDQIDPTLLRFEPPLGAAYLETLERQRRQRAGARGSEWWDEPTDGADAVRQDDVRTRSAPARDVSPAPPPRRLVAPGRCRWTGVNDLLVEELLQAHRPTRRGHVALSPLLDEVAESSGARRGGVAAFAIAAIEWLASGYSAAEVRRLLERLPVEGADPSRDLLELVCTLFEIDEDEAPERIAAALEDGLLPPVLAAIVHHRRALWRPMRLTTLGLAFRAAKAFLDSAESGELPPEAVEEEATQHLERLERASRELEADQAAPLVELAGTADEEAADPASRLKALAESAEEMSRQRDELRARLRELQQVKAAGELQSEELVELTAIAAFADRLASEPETALSEIEAIKEAGAVADKDAIATIDSATEQLQELIRKRGPFRKALTRLLPEETASDQPDEDESSAALESPREEAAVRSPEQEAADGGSSLRRLAQAVEEIEHQVTELFARANGTFAAYSAESNRLPPIRALRISVLAREAETLYRLGRRRAARRAWLRVLREDPLSLGALHNVAVVDTLASESSRQLESWRRFSETLYYFDVVAGTPHAHAARRAGFHRDFGGAYAPGVLSGEGNPLEAVDIDEAALSEFMTSRTRVRLFVDHKLLEALNAKLDFTSPPLILGVSRSEGDELRANARADFLAFVDEVSELVPERVRGAFAELCRQRIEAAYRACQSARRITLEGDPSYPGEVRRATEVVKSICEVKYRIFVMLMNEKNQKRISKLESLDFVNELARLDRIPIASSPELLRKALEELRIGDDPNLFVGMMGVLRRQLLVQALNEGNTERFLPAALAHLRSTGEDAELAKVAIQVAATEAQQAKSSEGLDDLLSSLDGWLKQARAGLAERGPVEGEDLGEEAITEEAVETVATQLDEAAVAIAIAPLGELGKDADWGAVTDTLTGLLDRHAVVAAGSTAFYLRMIARRQRLESASPEPEQVIRELEKVRKDARKVVSQSKNESQIEEAKERIEEAKLVVEQLKK